MATAPSNPESAIRALNHIKNQENLLFSQTPCFWKLSDLAILYPDIFDVKKPLPETVAKQLAKTVAEQIPEFASLTPRPVHISTVKETYNIAPNQIVKNGTNQHLTNVACEYLFSQHNRGAYLAQSYFLQPNKTTQEIASLAIDLRFERIRSHIADSVVVLSGIINRAKYANKNSYCETWALIWRKFYDTNNGYLTPQVRSPIDHISSHDGLITVYLMIQSINAALQGKTDFTIDHVKNCAANKATNARKYVIYNQHKLPEDYLEDKSSRYRYRKIQDIRKKFWMENYQNSL